MNQVIAVTDFINEWQVWGYGEPAGCKRHHEAHSFCQVINQPVRILDVTPWKLRLVLYYLAALFLQVLFRFLYTLDSNFQHGSKGRTSFDKQIDVRSVEADHI